MQSYISRYGSPHPLIKSARPCKAGIIVAIPSKNESGLLDVLKSVVNCIEPDCAVEIIALLNSASDSDGSVKEFHSQQYVACRRWAAESTPEWLNIHILRQDDLPPSTAGVGLARKIIMDEAVRRFSDASDSEQIILSLDADTLVSPDYLVEVWNSFKKKEDYDAANIYFEHPISGTEFESNIYQAIIDYELHLRYYRQGLKYTGHPFHHHCVGSALAVRNRSYQKFGGMNTRKAGEDFYFFQKIAMNGKVFDITSTCVYPSPRISDRVVFGTGRAVSDILSSESQEKFTYHPSMFLELASFFRVLPEFYSGNLVWRESVSDIMLEFLELHNFENKLAELKKHTSNAESFKKRFFQWFNAFQMLKFAHYYRDNQRSDIEVEIAAKMLLDIYGLENIPPTKQELLFLFRKRDREGFKCPL